MIFRPFDSAPFYSVPFQPMPLAISEEEIPYPPRRREEEKIQFGNTNMHILSGAGDPVRLGSGTSNVSKGQPAVEHPEAPVQQITIGRIGNLIDGALSKQNEKGIANQRKRFDLPSSN